MLTISSTGKTCSLTGWKIGYAICPEPLTNALRSVHQFVTFATATPLREAMADGIQEAANNGYHRELTAAYDKRRQGLTTHLEKAGFDILPSHGRYFFMAGFGSVTNGDFCRWTIIRVGVAAISPSAFYQKPRETPLLVRFCFARKRSTIDDIVHHLLQLRWNAWP